MRGLAVLSIFLVLIAGCGGRVMRPSQMQESGPADYRHFLAKPVRVTLLDGREVSGVLERVDDPPGTLTIEHMPTETVVIVPQDEVLEIRDRTTVAESILAGPLFAAVLAGTAVLVIAILISTGGSGGWD